MGSRHLPLVLGRTPGNYLRNPLADDVQQWAVYAAEQSLERGREWNDLSGVRGFLDGILSDRRFKDRYPKLGEVVLLSHGRIDDDSGASWGGPGTAGHLLSGHIDLHATMFNEMVLLHELAHVVSPWHTGPPQEITYRNGYNASPNTGRDRHGHSRWFRATYAWLCEQFGTDGTHAELGDAYAHYGLSVPADGELLEGMDHDTYWMEKLVEVDAWNTRQDEDEEEPSAEFMARMEAHGAKEPRIPDMNTFGVLFMDLRRMAHGAPKKRVAEIISRVQRCTTADVTRMESLPDAPEGDCERRLAVYLAVTLGADPRWAMTAFGVHRFHPDIRMGDLGKLNPAWVRKVRWMNRTLRAHPPLWREAGTR